MTRAVGLSTNHLWNPFLSHRSSCSKLPSRGSLFSSPLTLYDAELRAVRIDLEGPSVLRSTFICRARSRWRYPSSGEREGML